MLTDRTLSALLPWWLFGYLAAALWVCLCLGWSKLADALVVVTLGAPAVALATFVMQQFLPSLLCEVLFVEYLLVVLSAASAALFGAQAVASATQTLAWHGLWRPLAWLVSRGFAIVSRGPTRGPRKSGRE